MPKKLQHSILILSIGVVLIVISYYFVDKPVAYWIHAHMQPYSWLKWFTYIIRIIYIIAPLGFIYLYCRSQYFKFNYFDEFLCQLCSSVAIAALFKNILKWVFGRAWPQTWICNNPSLISDHVFGFHFFSGGFMNQSFPSGHTTLICAAMVSVWLYYPKLRWFALLLIILVIVGLLGMDYHFISDIIAGALLGALISFAVHQFNEFRQKQCKNSENTLD